MQASVAWQKEVVVSTHAFRHVVCCKDVQVGMVVGVKEVA